MEFAAILRALLRRWYVVLLGLVATGLAVNFAAGHFPPSYEAKASVILLPPESSLPKGANPLLQLSGLEQPAALVVAYLSGNASLAQLDEAHPDVTREVVLDPLSRGPIVMITVDADTPDAAMAALDTSMAQVPAALAAIQDEVATPGDARLGSAPLVVDEEPTTSYSTTLRVVVAAVAAGLALTIAGTVALDSLLRRHRDRRRAAELSVQSPADSAPEGPPSGVPEGLVDSAEGSPEQPPSFAPRETFVRHG